MNQEEKDFLETQRRAKQGKPLAMFSLGVLFEKRGNPQAAEHWYRKASEEGQVDAMFNLALLVGDSDPAQQETLYRLAADRNHPKSMHNLALMIWEKSPVEAAILLRGAEILGFDPSSLALRDLIEKPIPGFSSLEAFFKVVVKNETDRYIDASLNAVDSIEGWQWDTDDLPGQEIQLSCAQCGHGYTEDDGPECILCGGPLDY